MSVVDFLSVNISCEPDFTEILVAELSELGYDSMMETEIGLDAYIKPVFFNKDDVDQLIKKYPQAHMSYEVEEVIERNWNEEWEKNYDPIHVDQDILVRATFHKPDTSFPYEIVINPRMSFGTGHHDTTYLMLKNQLGVDHKGKRVIDAGCGTGILAIMAEKLGASEVVAYDNNSWSTENAPQNIELNKCEHIKVMEGTIATLDIGDNYDIILANINKNVLLDEMSQYVEKLSEAGKIIFSGFYESDANDLKQAALENNLSLEKKLTRNKWCSLIFSKNQM